MMKNELKQSLKTTLNQIEELKKKAEEIIEELKKEEIPLYPKFEKDSAVFFMDVNFNVREGTCHNPKAISDYDSFHSEHYAEMLAERSNYLAMLLHCKWYFDPNYEPDWDNPIEKNGLLVLIIRHINLWFMIGRLLISGQLLLVLKRLRRRLVIGLIPMVRE